MNIKSQLISVCSLSSSNIEDVVYCDFAVGSGFNNSTVDNQLSSYILLISIFGDVGGGLGSTTVTKSGFRGDGL